MDLTFPAEPLTGRRRSALTTCVVVSCFNEAGRLDAGAMQALADEPALEILFVDDGSQDATGAVLDELATRRPSISVVHLPTNRGKGEAVRRGLLAALDPTRRATAPDAVA